MSRLGRLISIAVIGLGIAALVMGVAFVVEGQSKANTSSSRCARSRSLWRHWGSRGQRRERY